MFQEGQQMVFSSYLLKSIRYPIDEMPNQLFSKGMVPTDFWESIKRRYPGEVNRNVKEIKLS